MSRKITANQFSVLFFICSVNYLFTLSSEAVGDHFWDSILSAILSALLGGLLSIPLCKLHDEREDWNGAQHIRETFRGFSKMIFFLYLLYFAAADIVQISLAQNLAASTVLPTTPAFLIGIMAVAVAVYGAKQGIETVARSGLFVLVMMLLGISAILFGVLPLLRADHREVMLGRGAAPVFSGMLTIFARSTFLPQMVFLFSFVKGKIFTKTFFWGMGVAGFSSVLFLFVVYCLGGFAATQFFPIYTLSTVSQLIPIQRLDILSGLVWLTALAVRLSCDFIAIGVCCKFMVSAKWVRWCFWGTTLGILILSAWITEHVYLRIPLFSIIPLFVFSFLLGCAVPLFLWFQKGKVK